MIAFDNSDLRDEYWQNALYVSNRLTRRIVAPTADGGFNTVVLMQPHGADLPDIRCAHTANGDVLLQLNRGELVLEGTKDPAQVRMVLRRH